MLKLISLSLVTIMCALPASAIYRACPDGSNLAYGYLVAATYDCRSGVIVSYKSESGQSFQRNLGCATEGSIRNLVQNGRLRDNDLTSESEFHGDKGKALLFCMSELDGQLPRDSQALVNITEIQQKVHEQGGRVFE